MVMSALPKVIFLYDNDAVEVRYSDESRLELSPCGSAMVFHTSPKPGEHPRHQLSGQIHKRTQFVTSDHKQKVLQALDFRNRFAEKPYLCEELMNKSDVVALYASVCHAKWPKSHSEAKIDVLADGSKKITSLDEFASLIVSPHGQDFSVCYLSRISSDWTNGDSLSLPLSQHYHSKALSNLDQKEQKKASEAVIYPYYHEQSDVAINANTNARLVSQQDASENVCEDRQVYSSIQQDAHCVVKCENDRGPCSPSCRTNYENDGKITKKSTTGTHVHLSDQISPDSKNIPSFPSNSPQRSVMRSNSNSHLSLESNCFPKESHVNEKQNFGDVSSSPVPHEISSISRSSTPDGLRTTIDSDATLIYETSAHEAVQCQQRHSSPSHSTNNPEDLHLPFAKLDLKSSFFQTLSSQLSNKNKLNSSSDQAFTDSPVNSKHVEAAPGLGVMYEQPGPEDHKMTVDKLVNVSHISDNNIDSTSCHSYRPTSTLCHSQDLDLTITDCEIHGKFKNYDQVQGTNTACKTKMSTGDETSDKEGALHLLSNQNDISDIQMRRPTMSTSQNRTTSLPVSQPFNVLHSNTIYSSNVRGTGDLTSMSVMHNSEKNLNHQILSKPQSYFSTETNDLELESKSVSRLKYVWTTSHASRNNCPKQWTHPLMLALQGEIKTGSSPGKPSTDGEMPLKEGDTHLTSLPQPLPLKCPFQHTHKSTPSQGFDEGEGQRQSEAATNVGVFHHGRLKVVLSEGIIYRLIKAPGGMTVVEIYPGDGSVLISQGAKALYFTHFIPMGDQLEERMYSIKSLPPSCARKFRPIEKMMKAANRFLHICMSWDKRVGKRIAPCWQKEMVAVIHPLPSSVLEECVVDGIGKFTAYSNGRVRVVFDDRTSLDMMSSFSPRLGSAVKNSPAGKEDGTVRFLLPSGNYFLVDKMTSGPYSPYLRKANEWVNWVNTSPSDRHKFYNQLSQPVFLDKAAKLELKKITCFNYILENTFLSPQQQIQSDSPQTFHNPCAGSPNDISFQPSTKKFETSPNPSTLRAQPIRTETPPNPSTLRTQPINSNPTAGSLGRNPSDAMAMNTADGFLSVRQALAQTSSLINDIEHFLEQNKS